MNRKRLILRLLVGLLIFGILAAIVPVSSDTSMNCRPEKRIHRYSILTGELNDYRQPKADSNNDPRGSGWWEGSGGEVTIVDNWGWCNTPVIEVSHKLYIWHPESILRLFDRND